MSWDTRFAAGVLISVICIFVGILFVFGILSVFVSIFELEIPSVMYFLVFR